MPYLKLPAEQAWRWCRCEEPLASAEAFAAIYPETVCRACGFPIPQ